MHEGALCVKMVINHVHVHQLVCIKSKSTTTAKSQSVPLNCKLQEMANPKNTWRCSLMPLGFFVAASNILFVTFSGISPVSIPKQLSWTNFNKWLQRKKAKTINCKEYQKSHIQMAFCQSAGTCCTICIRTFAVADKTPSQVAKYCICNPQEDSPKFSLWTGGSLVLRALS